MSYNYLLAAIIRQEHPAKVRADPRHESPLRYRAATKSKPRMVLHKSCNTRQRQFDSCATARRSTDCDENNHVRSSWSEDPDLHMFDQALQ
jgi:hypothetical protein